MEGGARANFTGASLEAIIKGAIDRKHYQFIKREKFDAARQLAQPIYTEQYKLQSIYESELKCDFILYHPQKHPESLIIEAKWQQDTGSVDEKYPFLVANIREKFPSPTIIVLDGGGYRKQAEAWLRKQVDH